MCKLLFQWALPVVLQRPVAGGGRTAAGVVGVARVLRLRHCCWRDLVSCLLGADIQVNKLWCYHFFVMLGIV